VVIAQDCERTVRAAISSVQWCARVVLADVGSTDRTADVAVGMGASVTRVAGRSAALDGLTGWVVVIEANELVPAALARRLETELGRGRATVSCPRRTWLLGQENPSSWPDRVRIAWHAEGDGATTQLPADRSLALIRLGPAGITSWWDSVGATTTAAAQGGVLSRNAATRIAFKALAQAAGRGIVRGGRGIRPAVLAALENWLWAVKAAEAAVGGEPAARAHYDEVAAAVLSDEAIPRPGGRR
jgi:glycosyltransferase involved in cell wall biosynthesis